jgi:hypothetical protein
LAFSLLSLSTEEPVETVKVVCARVPLNSKAKMADKEEAREEKVVVIKQESLPIRYVAEEEYETPQWETIELSDEDSEVEVDEVAVQEAADFVHRMKRETKWKGQGSPFVAALKQEIGDVPGPVTAGLHEQVQREVSISPQHLKRI